VVGRGGTVHDGEVEIGMFDPLTLVAGGALVAGGWLFGRRTNRQPRELSQPGTVCSCEHGYGSHEAGKACYAQIQRPHYWGDGHRNGYEWAPCPCLSYDGPEPLPRVWSTE